VSELVTILRERERERDRERDRERQRETERDRESLLDYFAISRYILICRIIVKTVLAVGEIRNVCDLYVHYYALLCIRYVILWTINKHNLDASGSRSEIPGKFRNVVLEEDGEDQLDRSCDK